MPIRITQQEWGNIDDRGVWLFTLENGKGSYVQLTNFGASILSIVVPDREGNLSDVVLGFNGFDGYYNDNLYIGTTIGRYANRIANASFQISDGLYQLEKNDGSHSNHGGFSGFHRRCFDYSIKADTLSFLLFSADGEGGYPGNLRVAIDYQWSEQHELTITYTATTDQETVVNLTNHAYFNLSGESTILNHCLHIASHELLETTSDHIPTGRIIPTGDLAFSGQAISGRVRQSDGSCHGINSCYVLAPGQRGLDTAACELLADRSGRLLRVSTSYPGLLLYTGGYLYRQQQAREPQKHVPFGGVCLECQYYPDSPNHPHFPSTLLKVGQTYHEFIRYHFLTIP